MNIRSVRQPNLKSNLIHFNQRAYRPDRLPISPTAGFHTLHGAEINLKQRLIRLLRILAGSNARSISIEPLKNKNITAFIEADPNGNDNGPLRFRLSPQGILLFAGQNLIHEFPSSTTLPKVILTISQQSETDSVILKILHPQTKKTLALCNLSSSPQEVIGPQRTEQLIRANEKQERYREITRTWELLKTQPSQEGTLTDYIERLREQKNDLIKLRKKIAYFCREQIDSVSARSSVLRAKGLIQEINARLKSIRLEIIACEQTNAKEEEINLEPLETGERETPRDFGLENIIPPS